MMRKPELLDLHSILKRGGVFCLLAFTAYFTNVHAQIIEGDVYGGGRDGHVGDATHVANPVVTVDDGAVVRTVFGGGLNGTVSGSTRVNIIGGTVGGAQYAGTATGGVYGAGEGASATVSGNASVYIVGGEVVNNVYGGGKMATLNGNSTVEIAGGRMKSDVYAGARAADIQGFAYAYVHFRSLIRSLFGGNDIGGEIRNASGDCPDFYNSVPSTERAASMPFAFLRIASGDAPASGDALTASGDSYPLFVANVYGGGNGDYTYTASGDCFLVELPNSSASGDASKTVFKVGNKPDLPRTFLDISGGTFYNVFGGGNMATITQATDIYLHEPKTDAPATLASADAAWMPAFDSESYTATSGITFKKQLYHLFGGNNLADMDIRPVWHLQSGLVYNIYSGGNKGDMTYSNGILLTLKGADMNVENVFGGCRMSNVIPTNTSINAETVDGYTFPANYGARVRITGGTIGNVYGGNDISGDVAFGTNVVIESDIVNDVYGSGNGSYIYTDKVATSDYYYDPGTGATALQSLQALNSHRPNSQKALITLKGTSGNITYIGGAVYCGGNSATLRSPAGSLSENVGASLEIGSYVIANRVFLGSNGENMVIPSVLQGYNENSWHSADFTNSAQFDEYMRGVEVAVRPNVTFTSDYTTGTSKIGSFFCGGNVGSMTAAGTFNVNFLNSLVIFDKLVAGCNNANVPKTAYNAYHMGGLTTHADLKVQLDINGLKMEPRKLTYDPVHDTFTFEWDTYNEAGKPTLGFLKGGNIYGGCYTSGYVDGAVEINIKSDLVTEETYNHIRTKGTDGSGTPIYGFHAHDWSHHSKEQSISTLSAFGGGYGEETEIWGNVNINVTANGRYLKVRGGSEKGWIGKMQRDADGILVAGTPFVAQLPDGTTTNVATKSVETAYNTTVTLNANLLTENGSTITNIGDICGGGYEGVVTGNSTVYLNSGCAYQVFGGASNADIYGGAEVFIGQTGMPYITQAVYGGNDFGGQIMGTLSHNVFLSGNTTVIPDTVVESNTYISFVSGEIGYATGEPNTAVKPDANFGIFGAANGCYDYDNSKYSSYISAAGFTKPNMLSHLVASGDAAYNSFVDISSSSSNKKDKAYNIYGGGEGYAGKMGLADTYNTYVLFNTKNAAERGGNENYIAQYVYAGGNCSRTTYSLLDAYSGYAKYIFGGCHGSSDKDQSLTYMGETATVNLYQTLNSPAMDVFGSGALSGTKETFVNVLGGTVNDVYGATYEEGITYQSTVNVPAASTATVNSLFGGGKGLSIPNACDTYIAVINFDAPNAKVLDAVYGGNNLFRLTRNSFLNISVPVKDNEGNLTDVYGAGYGANTFASQTYLNLKGTAKSGTAQVRNVYGGGRDGSVYNAPTLAKFLTTFDYYALDGVDATTYLTDTEVQGFETWKTAKGSAVIVDDIKYSDIAAISLSTDVASTDMNTLVMIPEGVTIGVNAYGGGYGENATVAGQTDVQLTGGKVTGDIYGGGYGGDVDLLSSLPLTTAQNITTNVLLSGGSTTNSYGGGYEGLVDGNANTLVGRSNCGGAAVTFLDGDPAIERSLYGGGQSGAVTGTATLTFNNGHVGYKYSPTASGDAQYVENVNLKTVIAGIKPDSLLIHNGNVFGGGYGEGAYTIRTVVNMYGGTIRNSIYGGGEIASIGLGSTTSAGDGSMNRVLDRTKTLEAGETHLTIFGGNILRDVFGGGRGYSYDLTGNELTGDRLYTDGYVFGSTEVVIHGGTIGTIEGIASGYGNVFGGGNVGFVYSVAGYKATDTSNDKTIGYYYNTSDKLTEDCRVVISPWCKVNAPVTVNGHNYAQCDYVTTEDLNTMKKGDTRWNSIDWQSGITVRNAVFAGGNVTRGSDKLYANTITVYGNVTASLNDIYHRDLISVGSDYVGGLYGDGNLTLVDGYREIAIVNYGTDYYNLQSEITVEEYNRLSDRERAYFTLKYKCVNGYTHGGKTYNTGDQITEEEYKKLDDGHKSSSYWQMSGFCSIYSGRILNTIQRADFCGMHGSRVVLQGAQDRVIDVMDYTNYAINRVGEVSLNKRNSVISGESEGQTYHGNYFGMYNVVNFLGALTSDVKFTDTRYAKNSNYEVDKDHGYIDKKPVASGDAPLASGDARSYYQFKKEKISDKRAQQYRNNGTSDNQIAMSQGVYLELVDHLATGDETVGHYTYHIGDKVYGPITGVVELDLINASPDMGGGYVYAQNIHGTPSFDSGKNAKKILSSYNTGAITNEAYSYTVGESGDKMQTSGNFVHYLKQIVDDCYPNNGVYTQSPAHFWYLRGSYFVYDQYVSAFTGSSTAYKADVQIPLTITSGSHGKLRVMEIKPNYYAYYKTAGIPMTSTDNIRANNITYRLNDVISYWDYSNLSASEQALFVPVTYVCKENLYSDAAHTTLAWAEGTVMLPETYETVKNTTYYDKNGNETKGSSWIRISNGTSHTNGFLLTADITNPLAWDDRYIKKVDDTSGTKTIITSLAYGNLSAAEKLLYAVGPTFTVTSGGVYGQRVYQVGDILTQEAVNSYEALGSDKPTEGQATVEKAYISTIPVSYTSQTGEGRNVQAGVAIPKSEYDHLGNTQPTAQAAFEEAYVCTSTFLKGDVYVLYSELYSKTSYDALEATYKSNFSTANYCSVAGKYGGTKYVSGQNFEALGAYCSMTDTDRDNFTYNFDAFDILYNNLTGDWRNGYSTSSDGNTYIQQIAIEYAATCHTEFQYTPKNGSLTTVAVGTKYTNSQFEAIPNERIHYAKLTTTSANEKVYYVKNSFSVGSVFYKAGATVSAEVFRNMDAISKGNIDSCIIANSGTHYLCKESYVVGAQGEGVPVTAENGGTVYADGATVPVGTVITAADHSALKNFQINFSISGESPIETSTLYVPRMADILDQTKERIITLIYQYQYEESTADGSETEEISERHILNIHLEFKTGVPTIGELSEPGIVLPGTTIGLKQPIVAQGAYEIIGGGWEIYMNKTDAENHENGIAYSNNYTPMYFYQDGYYAAYYTKTYLGKTYSNAVPFKVANYHSIDDVMADTVHHLYIDNPNVKRNCKVYITGNASSSDPDNKNEIDLLMDLHTLCSVGLTGHSAVSENIKDCQKLDIVLSENVQPKGAWTPIGDEYHCFEGDIHGDGNYIEGLDQSLFGYMCGNVYNLGLLGSFIGSGLSDHGDGNATNCWMLTTGTPSNETYPFMGSGAGVITNCYYYNDYKNPTGLSSWEVYKKPLNAFNNGDVAYNLNRYYLKKRYIDTRGLTTNEYNYYTIDNTTDELLLRYAYNHDVDAPFSFTDKDNVTHKIGYVESRFIYGDFIYAKGVLTTDVDERLYSDDKYFPIYPDDYIYFGQMLSYNFIDQRPHQEYPTAVARTTSNRMLTSTNSSTRVYRSPAYYGNKNMSLAYFNVNAVLPSVYTKSSNTTDLVGEIDDSITEDKTTTTTNVTVDGRTTTTTTVVTTESVDHKTRTIETTVRVTTEKDAYPGMTALDLTGKGDFGPAETYNGFYYTPIKDYNGIIGFNNIGQTQNMLVYADPTNDAVSYSHLSAYFIEPVMAIGTYNTIDVVNDADVSSVHGHLADRLPDGTFQSSTDHFLVDKQPFNAPIAYTFSGGNCMWYQRKPDYYASTVNGSDAVSLPFEASLVTTQDKGEITHFYTNSDHSGEKGHEYWLRTFQGVDEAKSTTSVVCADFGLLSGGTSTKTDYNTFLWDYYYSNSTAQDANQDKYFEYYKTARTYANYPLAQPAVPYLIGLPGKTYYEFDLSGTFEPKHTYTTISKLDAQVITWASDEGVSIAVSDDELAGAKASAGGYVFKPNYGASQVPAGAFMLNADGSGFDVTATSTKAIPFRPYFTLQGASPAPGVQKIVFSPVDLNKGSSLDPVGGIEVWVSKNSIVVESHLDYDRTVTIINSIGLVMARFNLTAGSRISTNMQVPGVYMVAGHKVVVK